MPARLTTLLCLLLVLMVRPGQAQDSVAFEGTAILMTRIAIPADATLVVEAASQESGKPLAEQRIATAGKQPPYPFTLTIARARIKDVSHLRLRVALVVRGQPRFVSEATPIKTDGDRISIGEIVMRPYRPLAFATDLICDGKPARFGIENNTPVLQFDGKSYRLREEKSASGTRYIGTDAKVTFRSKGNEATLTLPSGAPLQCRKVATNQRAADDDMLIARGNEPSWQLTIGQDGLSLKSFSPDLMFSAKNLVRDTIDGRPRFTATADDKKLVVTILEHLCADSVTGMPFPVATTIEFGARRLQGCGGHTMNAIEGGWRVIRLENDPLTDGAIVTLEFNRDGRVSGRSGCNRYTGPYTLTGEGLTFGNPATTRMACPPPLMEIEARFLKLLASVTRVTPGENGQLHLMAGDRQVLVLDRAR